MSTVCPALEKKLLNDFTDEPDSPQDIDPKQLQKRLLQLQKQRILEIKTHSERLSQHRKKINYFLHVAAYEGDLKQCQKLIAQGADPSYIETDINCTVLNGVETSGVFKDIPPIITAAKAGKANIVEYFASLNPECVDATTPEFCTPMIAAAYNGNLNVMDVLNARNATINSYMCFVFPNKPDWYPSLLSYICSETTETVVIKKILLFRQGVHTLNKHTLDYHDGMNTALGHILLKTKKLDQCKEIVMALVEQGARAFTLPTTEPKKLQAIYNKIRENYAETLERLWLEAESMVQPFFPNGTQCLDEKRYEEFCKKLQEVSGSFFNCFRNDLEKVKDSYTKLKQKQDKSKKPLQLIMFDSALYRKFNNAFPVAFSNQASSILGIIMGYCQNSFLPRYQSSVEELHRKRLDFVYASDPVKDNLVQHPIFPGNKKL